jgi:hypothetical protein
MVPAVERGGGDANGAESSSTADRATAREPGGDGERATASWGRSPQDGDVPVFGPWGPPLRVRIERSPVWAFARALTDDNPLYASEDAARAAGLPGVPCPPTYTFAMVHAGAWRDIQPEDGRGTLRAGGGEEEGGGGGGGYDRDGLYLHGEQHFEYHRQPLVGDELEGRMRVSEPWTKEGSRGVMELTVLETQWTDVATGEPVVTERIVSVFLPRAAGSE